jgi:homoserine dehydrogenase
VSQEAALAEAQELGLAEPDPSYDISGLDTAQKLVILGNALLDEGMKLSDVKITGIKGVTSEAVDLAEKHGYSIKLIGDVAGREVSPRLVPKSHPLNVGGSLNAITVVSDVAGELTFAGPGAGPRETSSALLSDLVNISLKITK